MAVLQYYELSGFSSASGQLPFTQSEDASDTYLNTGFSYLGGGPTHLEVTDSDTLFQDATTGTQLGSELTLANGSVLPQGTMIEPNYGFRVTYTGEVNGQPAVLEGMVYVIGTADGQIIGIASDFPLQPGTDYTIRSAIAAPQLYYGALQHDYVVDGTEGGDLMDSGYRDRHGERMDGGDNAPAADPDADLAFGYGGDDTIYGGAGADSLHGGRGNDQIWGGRGDDVMSGGQGQDSLYGDEGQDHLYGGEGADLLKGGEGDDLLVGYTGDGGGGADDRDTIFGGFGSDTIHGDAGDDLLSGDGGSDFLYGGEGNDEIHGHNAHDQVTDPVGDELYGGAGSDSLYGGSGADLLDGGSGNDRLFGGAGGDALFGAGGSDFLSGGSGNDQLFGGEGPDTLYGGAGDDYLEVANGGHLDGGDGDDALRGGDQASTLYGGAGQDLIFGSQGADLIRDEDAATIYGGGGNDDIRLGSLQNAAAPGWIEGEDGDDIIDVYGGGHHIRGGEGNDDISVSAAPGLGVSTIYGGSGDDKLTAEASVEAHGGDGSDYFNVFGPGVATLYGGSGDDLLSGGAGDDRLYGEEDDDLLSGGDGADSLFGGTGRDTLFGDSGADHLEGGAGDDTLIGDAGSDTLYGGEGNDVIGGGEGSYRFVDGQTHYHIDPDDAPDSLYGGEGFDTFYVGSGDVIADFNTATGGDIRDGDRSNNDFVDLSHFYNASTLAVMNAARSAMGEPAYRTPLDWLRADQADGVLSDISPANGFQDSFTLHILNGGVPVAGSDLTVENTNVICFAATTVLQTPKGGRAAGGLRPGDLVSTRSGRAERVTWCGLRRVSCYEMQIMPHLRPVLIPAHALGPGCPAADLLLSGNHRLQLEPGGGLLAARLLLGRGGVRRVILPQGVDYVHILFDRHLLLDAQGVAAESLWPGPKAMDSLDPASREEIYHLYPALRYGWLPDPAAAFLQGKRALHYLDRLSGPSFSPAESSVVQTCQ